jgi:ubiquinone/menaquinone biosynthesis C-methylase UbiE
MTKRDPTERFSSRVEAYTKYRPSYPTALISTIRERCGIKPGSSVADIGSGTGISTELLLEHGYRVFAVEPNREMREAAEALLAKSAGFVSVDGGAEATTLADRSIDLVLCAQAFHWFDHSQCRVEFERILKPGGSVMLVWNGRRTTGEPFLESYERLLLTFSDDYAEVRHENAASEAQIASFFEKSGYESVRLDNVQVLDWVGIRGRLLSTSYAPEPGHPKYEPMLDELRRIFDATSVDGVVRLEYDTTAYFGKL